METEKEEKDNTQIDWSLYNQYIPLVYRVLRRMGYLIPLSAFENPSLEWRGERVSMFQEDLVYEGKTALLKSMQSYNPKKGTEFITHAWNVIFFSINTYLRDKRRDFFNSRKYAQFLNIQNPVETPEQQCIQGKMQSSICRLVDSILTERERDVIQRRYGFGNDGVSETQQSIANSYGSTYPAIQKTERKALQKLRQSLA